MDQEVKITAALIEEKLSSIREITSKKMFGGYGVFQAGKMFALIDAKGVFHLKADEGLKNELIQMGSKKHSRMPYYSIPSDIINNDSKLIELSKRAIEISKA